jgi:uncharacterized SAM-binding protein YcdF (DUF218 family)
MERSVRNFAKNNIKIQPYPTDYTVNSHLQIYSQKFFPTIGGLSITCIALREYMGIVALYFTG